MADVISWPAYGREAQPCLCEAALPRATLWACCACGDEAMLDPAPWLDQGLAQHPLSGLEDRLRCSCGARRAKLEIRGLAEVSGSAPGAVFIFR